MRSKSMRPVRDQEHAHELDPIVDFKDASCEVARLSIRRLDSGMQSVTTALVKVRRLGDSGLDFVSRQIAGRNIPGVYGRDEKKSLFCIGNREARDLVPCASERAFLVQRDRVVQRTFVAKPVEDQAGEFLFVIDSSLARPDGILDLGRGHAGPGGPVRHRAAASHTRRRSGLEAIQVPAIGCG
jgi:hypothetical protein